MIKPDKQELDRHIVQYESIVDTLKAVRDGHVDPKDAVEAVSPYVKDEVAIALELSDYL